MYEPNGTLELFRTKAGFEPASYFSLDDCIYSQEMLAGIAFRVWELPQVWQLSVEGCCLFLFIAAIAPLMFY